MLATPAHGAFNGSYDLPTPKTLQQLRTSPPRHGENFDTVDGEWTPIVLHLKVPTSLYHTTLATSFAVTPGEMSRTQGVYWFDPVDMTPLINSPGHVKALEYLKDLAQYGPAAHVSWSLGEAWDFFLRGKAIFNFSYGDVAPLAQDEARSKIRGKIGSAILPASDTYWDMNKKEFVTARSRAGRQRHRRSGGAASPACPPPRLLVPVADGDQAGVEVACDLRLGRRRPRLQLPDARAGRGGEDRGLPQGGLGRGRRQGLPAGLLRQLQRPDHPYLSADRRCPRILGHHGQEPVGRDAVRRLVQQALDDTAAAWSRSLIASARQDPGQYQEAIGYELS
jgi:hypothetical protein